MQLNGDDAAGLKPAGGARCAHRSAAAAVAGLVLPLVMLRAVFLLAEVRASLGCRHWVFGLQPSDERFLWDYGGFLDPSAVERAPESLDELIAQLGALAARNSLDVETTMLNIKAMLARMDGKVQLARTRAAAFLRLASAGVPKSVHCVSMNLAEEYYGDAAARAPVPSPEFAHRLTDHSYRHVALITDNVLAAAVAVASCASSAAHPERLVVHVITDRKTYAPMHAWFALHPVSPAIVEVRGVHQLDLPADGVAAIARTAQEVRRSLAAYRDVAGFEPGAFSLMNYLKIHLPRLFPKLDRLILLDDDVIVRKDLSELWDLDLNGSIVGAVGTDETIGDLLNLSNPVAAPPFSSMVLDAKRCAWLWGVNAVDLAEWRKTNATETFQLLLRHNRESNFSIMKPGVEAPSTVALAGRVHPISPTWHLAGLGRRMASNDELRSAAVLHFSGPAKPWLDIGLPELRRAWRSHLNSSDEIIRSCGVL